MHSAIISNVKGVSSYGNPWGDKWNHLNKPGPGFHIAVHCGSGKQFLDLFKHCNLWGVPLIQASSSLKESSEKDAKPIVMPDLDGIKFPYIQAPNLALPVAALFRVLPAYGEMIQKINGKTSVLESHQASKKSAPITAQKILGLFGGKPEGVFSERDPVKQKLLLGVPNKHLGAHAIHMIEIDCCGMRIQLEIRIYGRQPYVEGLGILIEKIVEMGDTLKPGVHQADELLFG